MGDHHSSAISSKIFKTQGISESTNTLQAWQRFCPTQGCMEIGGHMALPL